MENIIQAVSDGVIITIVGMLVVFGFLTIMVIAMNITSGIVAYLNKKFPPKVVETATTKKKSQTNEEEMVAIAVASILNLQRSGR